jgi:hypothetical protein
VANRKYIVTGPFPAYGVQTGDPTMQDDTDDGVQANIAAGILVLAPEQPAVKAKPCPACDGQGVKRPQTFATQAELEAHYDEKHPALVTPDIEEGE